MKGIRKLDVVVGVNNTHVDVHHVVEDGDRNSDTDVDVDVDVAAAIAAGEVPPTITTYEIMLEKSDPVEAIFYKRSYELKDEFKVEAFDQLKSQNRIFLSVQTDPVDFVTHSGLLTCNVLDDV